MIKTTILVRVEGDGLSAEAPYELCTHEHIFDKAEVEQHANKVLSSFDVVEAIRSLAAEAVEAASDMPEKQPLPEGMEDENTPESVAAAIPAAANEAPAQPEQTEADNG